METFNTPPTRIERSNSVDWRKLGKNTKTILTIHSQNIGI
jgi:hypothetical protein